MERKSMIAWMDAIKLAVGIMLGLTSTLLVIMYIAEGKDKSDAEYGYEEKEWEPTIEERLLLREKWRAERQIDSIYMALPDEILIAIYTECGTMLTECGVVVEYCRDQEKYDKILKNNGNQ